jgi:heptosyltransferase I
MPHSDTPKRILVVKLSSLGDLFHALPAVHNLKVELGVSVDWVTQTNYVDLVRYFTDVDRVIGFPRRGFLGQAGPFLRELRRESYSHVIDLQGLLKSAFVSRLARADLRIGPSFAREGSRLFYTVTAARADKERHAVDEALDVVRYLGLREHKPAFPVSFHRKAIDEPHPRVALIPRSRWETKNWPVDRFTAVARGLQEKAGVSVFLVGGPDDTAACGQIETGLQGRVVNLCGRTSLVELGSLLQEMDLVISVDSGPMHMAAAVGRPVLAVFGATDPKRTGPYGPALAEQPGLPAGRGTGRGPEGGDGDAGEIVGTNVLALVLAVAGGGFRVRVRGRSLVEVTGS